MSQTMFAAIKTETAEENGFFLTYHLLEADAPSNPEEEETAKEVQKTFSFCIAIENGAYRDEKIVSDVTRDKKRAEELFDTLQRLRVTPCTLVDVLSDIL